MASSSNFTLDDDEELGFPRPQASSLAPVAPVSPHPMEPVPTSTFSPLGSVGSLSIQLRDPPKSHVDADLGVNTLAQVVQVLHDNQHRIEEAESQLQGLLRQHARLVAAGRLLEQQKVLDVLATGPDLGYDAGRPVASLLVYRSCQRWGCFSGDAQAAAVLDHLSALLLAATDEDAIVARRRAAARALAGSSGGDAGSEGRAAVPEDGVALAEQSAAAEATREVAYWLAVTSILLALVDPHLPLIAGAAAGAATGGSTSAAAGHAGPAASAHLAVVAGDARASMARAASAAAAKVQEIQKRMGTTFTGMQLLGKNLLMRGRRGKADSAGAAAATTGSGSGGGGEGSGEGHLEQEQQPAGQGRPEPSRMSAGGEAQAEASAKPQASLPPASTGGGSSSRSGSPVTELLHPAPIPAPAVPPAAPPPGGPVGGAPRPPLSHPPASQVAFRQHLDVVVQKSYVQMRDSLKRHVSAVLPGCVQQPPPPFTPWGSLAAGGGGNGEQQQQQEVGGEAPGRTPDISAGGAAPHSLSRAPSSCISPLHPWWELVGELSRHLELLREVHVPRILIRCLFKQTLSFIDVQLFNQLMLRPECCSSSNARYLVEGLQVLEAWLRGAGPAAGAASPGAVGPGPAPAPAQAPGVATAAEELAVLADDLRHIRQAAHFLVLANKGALRLDDFTAMCPDLNMQHLYRLATTFWDDSPVPQPQTQQPRTSLEVGAAPAAAGASKEPAPEMDETAAEGVAEGAGGDGPAMPEAKDASGYGQAPGTATAAAAEAEGETDVRSALDPAGQPPAYQQAGDTAHAPVQPAEQEEEDGEGAQVLVQLGSVPAGEPGAAVGGGGGGGVFSRNVSGEVLEEMKRRHCVANNGGLIVTFLLDEDSSPLIVQGAAAAEGGGAAAGGGNGGGEGVVARQLLQVINEPRLHEGLKEGLPRGLCGEDCPPQVFAFMIDGRAVAAAAEGPAAPSGGGS